MNLEVFDERPKPFPESARCCITASRDRRKHRLEPSTPIIFRINGEWFLFGCCHLRRYPNICSFRVCAVDETGDTFKREKFNIEDRYKNSVHSGERPSVTIPFASGSRLHPEKIWHHPTAQGSSRRRRCPDAATEQPGGNSAMDSWMGRSCPCAGTGKSEKSTRESAEKLVAVAATSA